MSKAMQADVNSSCVRCSELKVRCDRSTPCLRCVRLELVCEHRVRVKRSGAVRKKLKDLKHYLRLTSRSSPTEISSIDCEMFDRDMSLLGILADTLGWEVNDAVAGQPNVRVALWHIATTLTTILSQKDFPCREYARFCRGHMLASGLLQLGLIQADCFTQFADTPALLEILSCPKLPLQSAASCQHLFEPWQNADVYGLDVPIATVQIRVAPEQRLVVINDAAGTLFQTNPVWMHRIFLHSGIFGLTFWMQMMVVEHVLQGLHKMASTLVSRFNRISSTDEQTVQMRLPDGQYRWLQMKTSVQFRANAADVNGTEPQCNCVHTLTFVPLDVSASDCAAM